MNTEKDRKGRELITNFMEAVMVFDTVRMGMPAAYPGRPEFGRMIQSLRDSANDIVVSLDAILEHRRSLSRPTEVDPQDEVVSTG